jgi:hypothetical protein
MNSGTQAGNAAKSEPRSIASLKRPHVSVNHDVHAARVPVCVAVEGAKRGATAPPVAIREQGLRGRAQQSPARHTPLGRGWRTISRRAPLRRALVVDHSDAHPPDAEPRVTSSQRSSEEALRGEAVRIGAPAPGPRRQYQHAQRHARALPTPWQWGLPRSAPSRMAT